MPYNYKQSQEQEKEQEPKQSQEQSFPLIMNGRKHEVSSEQIAKLLKKRLSTDVAVLKLFERFEIDVSRLADLQVQVVDLEGRYAETDDQTMSLDIHLFDGGNFFEDNYFVAVHELVHWLSRMKEADAYFNDPEEVLGFIAAIASEIYRGTSLDVIWNKIYPRVEFHFHNEEDSREFFSSSIKKAKELLV